MSKHKAHKADPERDGAEAQDAEAKDAAAEGSAADPAGAPGDNPGDNPGAKTAARPETADPREHETGGETGAAEPGEAGPDRAARLEAEVAELKDRLLRALAETENVRRRAERDRQEALEYGSTRLARDLLAVYDNLERALGHADDAAREHAGSVIEGIELTRRELVNAFSKNRIEKFTPEKGEKFDPHFQQAMYEAPVPGAKPGTVIEAIQAGFTISGRLLRPALVGVAKAASEGQQAPKENIEPKTGKPSEAGSAPGGDGEPG